MTVRETFQRNVRVRLAVLGATISDIARAHDISRAAVDRRLLRQRLSDELLQWWGSALAMPLDLLVSDQLGAVAEYPIPQSLIDAIRRTA